MAYFRAVMELGGEASAWKLAKEYGGAAGSYRSCAINIGKRALKYFNMKPCPSDTDEDKSFIFAVPFQGHEVIEDGVKSYAYRIRPELQEALNEIDLFSYDIQERFDIKEDDTEKHYWWLCANPKNWKIRSLLIGEEQSYEYKNENGNKRKIYKNFLDAKVGDIVIGYESNPVKQVVALLRVSNKQKDGLSFQLVEILSNPIDYRTLKECPELADMEYFNQPQGSLFKLTNDEFDFIMDMIREDNPLQNRNPKEPLTGYNEDSFKGDMYMEEAERKSLIGLLNSKKNIILQGAPGVGKTFAAKKLAYLKMGEIDESRIKQIQFHQNYSYEDFVMGYKPTDDGGFEMKYGVFYRFCQLASNQPDKDFFFIIDEINRGNMSKIFGELLMLIEEDYRGPKNSINLAYNDEPFYVPKNLYIIGMMNTADRSLAMIDYALRRRFSFFTMKPGFDSEAFKAYKASVKNDKLDKLIEEVKELNNKISEDRSLGAGFCIGHSYFCKLTHDSADKRVKEIVNYEIVPMLQEYWFDNEEKVKEWTGRLNGVIDGKQ